MGALSGVTGDVILGRFAGNRAVIVGCADVEAGVRAQDLERQTLAAIFQGKLTICAFH